MVSQPSPLKKNKGFIDRTQRMNIDRIYNDLPDRKKLRIIPNKSKSSVPQQQLMDEVNKHIQQIPVHEDSMENTDVRLIKNYEKQL